MTSRLVNVEPPELRFTYEVNKKATCILRLFNQSQYPVAFKVMTTDPMKYAVRPNIGVLNSLSACDVQVGMRAPTDILPDMMQCKDKFLIKSVIASPSTTTEDVKQLFEKPRHSVEDFKLKVVYIYPSASSTHQRSQVAGENGVDYGDLIMKIFNFVFGVFVVWFLVMKMLPAIWSLAFWITTFVMCLTSKLASCLINKFISDSVEDWILKIICYVFVHYIWRNLRNIGKLLKRVQ